MWTLISTAQLEQYLDDKTGMFLLDVRDEAAYEKSHIKGAVNIPADQLMSRLSELPNDRLIVIYCYRGPHSMLAARQLSSYGYQVADVYGGIAWYRGKYLT